MIKLFLLFIRKLYRAYFKKFKLKKFRKSYIKKNRVILSPETTSKLIYKIIVENKPSLITRFGRTEFAIICNYLGIINQKFTYVKFIQENIYENWWNENLKKQIFKWSGFFPVTDENLHKFSKLYLSLLNNINVLGVYLDDPRCENFLSNRISRSVKVDIDNLSGFHSEFFWTKALKNKKVLIIHPFSETIEKQYKKKDLIFENNFLPNFEIKLIKAVQSISGHDKSFHSWFDALDSMKSHMEKIDFDVALIGCGAYGLPLAAHAKKIGKIGFHLGGELQLLFGIIGKRWEDLNLKNSFPTKNKLVNEHWVRPSINERPKNYKKVENGCYW